MAHLWPIDWYDLSDGEEALQNIAKVWGRKGYDSLSENDYARMEPFLEPFDGVYTDQEIVILSRIGNNGIQKEFCSMFLQGPEAGAGGPERDEDGIWVLEWYLDKNDIRRLYLRQVAQIMYGSQFENDETQCMIMLTHSLSSLRRLKITIHGDQILGEFDDGEVPETVVENSLEDPEIVTLDDEDDDGDAFLEEDLMLSDVDDEESSVNSE